MVSPQENPGLISLAKTDHVLASKKRDMTAIVVVPTYNERENLEDFVNAVRRSQAR